jgi:tripartite-type tricarboxylate transporter receptor subunit TctC
VIVPFPAGASVDVVVRIVSYKLAEQMRQHVVVDNRPGASGNVGTELAARAAADGYTVLATTVPLVVNPSLFAKVPYDVLRDFRPVSLLASTPFVLVANPSLPVRSVAELITYARARPGDLNYSSGGSGTNPRIAAELFMSLAKVSLVHVPYKNSGLALTAVLSNETHLTFLAVATVGAHVRTGRLRALGVTADHRSPVLPQVPTIAEAGLPGYAFSGWYGVLLPAAAPSEVVAALNGYIRNASHSPEMAERLANEGAEVVAGSPEHFGKHLRAELARWAKVVKEGGLKID